MIFRTFKEIFKKKLVYWFSHLFCLEEPIFLAWSLEETVGPTRRNTSLCPLCATWQSLRVCKFHRHYDQLLFSLFLFENMQITNHGCIE